MKNVMEYAVHNDRDIPDSFHVLDAIDGLSILSELVPNLIIMVRATGPAIDALEKLGYSAIPNFATSPA